MTTKTCLILSLLLLSCTTCLGQRVEMTVKVVDEFGKPVPGATAGIGTFQRWRPGEGFGEDIYKDIKAKTDTNGMVTLKGRTPRGYVPYGIDPMPGYYYTSGSNYWFPTARNGEWKPWNPTVVVVLRPILNPVPMYAKWAQSLVLPEIDKEFGCDLMIGDWVKPYGKGVTSDLVFQLNRKPVRTVLVGGYRKTQIRLFDAVLTVSFSNEDDGIQVTSNEGFEGSEFRLARNAPEEGYQSKLTKHYYHESADKPVIMDPKEGQDYFYRVRTVKKNGQIVSALYGKIVGDISFEVLDSPTADIVFRYYLNAEPNSRNMEFDTTRNLFKRLMEAEKIHRP